MKVPSTIEYKARRKDGTEFWALLNFTYLYENEKPIGARVVECGFGRNRIISTLKEHAGLNIDAFQLWNVDKSGHRNGKIYTLNR